MNQIHQQSVIIIMIIALFGFGFVFLVLWSGLDLFGLKFNRKGIKRLPQTGNVRKVFFEQVNLIEVYKRHIVELWVRVMVAVICLNQWQDYLIVIGMSFKNLKKTQKKIHKTKKHSVIFQRGVGWKIWVGPGLIRGEDQLSRLVCHDEGLCDSLATVLESLKQRAVGTPQTNIPWIGPWLRVDWGMAPRPRETKGLRMGLTLHVSWGAWGR
jgi:hypothetical protein